MIISFIKRLLKKRRSHPKVNRDIPAEFVTERVHHSISKSDISMNALKVLNRLDSAGYEAFLVGGSVRDLLLNKRPKDFDIATDAHPQQIKDLFRNCRLIGKRFRLAHVHFGREILEVATFRAAPTEENTHDHKSEDGRILRDNQYGDIHDDVWRRDFTVNALYYNIADFSIVDFCDGLADIKAKHIRLIGEPDKRYREDPVRMLRAVRFAAKLDFTIEKKTAAPIASLAHLLTDIPSSRLFDELVKLYHCGEAYRAQQLMYEFKLFSQLFPMVEHSLQGEHAKPCAHLINATLKNTDHRIRQNKTVNPAFLLAVLLWYPLLEEIQRLEATGLPPLVAIEQAMSTVISKQVKLIGIPKRFSQVMREIWLLQYRFPRRHGNKAQQLLTHPRFRAGYDFLLLRVESGEEEPELGQWWTEFQTKTAEEQIEMVSLLGQAPAKKKRRRRKKPV